MNLQHYDDTINTYSTSRYEYMDLCFIRMNYTTHVLHFDIAHLKTDSSELCSITAVLSGPGPMSQI